MAKFIYRMENILQIKYKLEEQAKQNYMEVQARLNEATDKLQQLQNRKQGYEEQYRQLVFEHLNILEIETCKNAILYMDDEIKNQQNVIHTIEKELEQALERMNEAMKDRKIHEKLKENQFEIFKQELNLEEMKEIDQLVSYQYNNPNSED